MLGLLPNGSSSEIKSDYSQSISQVYRDVVTKQLEEFGDCKILQSCELERSQTRCLHGSRTGPLGENRYL